MDAQYFKHTNGQGRVSHVFGNRRMAWEYVPSRDETPAMPYSETPPVLVRHEHVDDVRPEQRNRAHECPLIDGPCVSDVSWILAEEHIRPAFVESSLRMLWNA